MGPTASPGEPASGPRTQSPTWSAAALRFALVGASNAAVSYTVFWLCLHAPVRVALHAGFSQLVAYAAGIAWSFHWNRRWTFRSGGPRGRQALRFTILQVGLALSSAALVGLAVDVVGFRPTPSWLVVMAGVTLVNFVLSRLWAFR